MGKSDNDQFDKAVLAMYEHAERRRGLQIDRIWETMKLTTQIIFAIVTVTIALSKFLEDTNVTIYSIPILVFLPLIMLLTSIWAFFNTRRQYTRFLEIITWINKLEDHLGIRKKSNEANEKDNEAEKRVYPKDDYLLVPDKWAKACDKKGKEYSKGKEFINDRRKFGKDSMYTFFGLVFFCYALIALVLIFGILLA